MPLAQSEIFIAAPPEEVWALISDLERGPEWSTVTLECELTSEGPPAIGCTYRATSKFASSKVTTEHEIVEWVPPHRMVTKVTKGAQSTFAQTCEPQREGTVLRMSNEFAAPVGLPRFLAEKLEQRVTSTLSKELARIKEVLEWSREGSTESWLAGEREE